MNRESLIPESKPEKMPDYIVGIDPASDRSVPFWRKYAVPLPFELEFDKPTGNVPVFVCNSCGAHTSNVLICSIPLNYDGDDYSIIVCDNNWCEMSYRNHPATTNHIFTQIILILYR